MIAGAQGSAFLEMMPYFMIRSERTHGCDQIRIIHASPAFTRDERTHSLPSQPGTRIPQEN